MRRIVAVAIVGIAVLITGCGSSTQSASVVPSTTVASATSTAPPPGSTSTTEAATIQPCRAGGLRAKVVDAGDGGAATRYLVVQVTNVGEAPCSAQGYFGVSSFDPAGHAIATQDAPDAQGSTARLTLAPGGSLRFVLGLKDLPSGAQGTCPRVGAFHLVPPDQGQFLQLSLLDAQGQGTQVVECPGPIVVRPITAVTGG